MADCQCTEYVAHRFGINGYPDAHDWNDGYLQRNGFHQVSAQVGAIAVMEASFPGANQQYGHVGVVVEQIEGDRIMVRGANQWTGTTPVTEAGCSNVRVTPFGPINRNDISFWVRGNGNPPPPPNSTDRKDPRELHCDADARTVTEAQIKNDQGEVLGVVELRYSDKCCSNWCRVRVLGDHPQPASLSGSVKRQTDGVTCEYSLENTTSLYTDMVYAPTAKAQACGSINGHSACTAFV